MERALYHCDKGSRKWPIHTKRLQRLPYRIEFSDPERKRIFEKGKARYGKETSKAGKHFGTGHSVVGRCIARIFLLDELLILAGIPNGSIIYRVHQIHRK